MDVLFGDPPPHRQCWLSRLEVEGDLLHGSVLFTLTEREGDSVSITASDGVSTWGGQLKSHQLRELAGHVHMATEEFTDELVKALSCEDLGTSQFAYSVKVNPSGSLMLAWKRHLVTDNVKYQLGEVVLDPQNSERVHTQLLECAVTTTSRLRTEIAVLKSEQSQLVSERQLAVKQLDKCVNIKEDVEADLYGKFKLVLNEKKGKIRRLMEQLSSLDQKNKVLETSAMAPEDHHDNSTDDESPARETPPPQPDESLLGGGAKGVSPPVKKRRRQVATRSTGQPEIPRPPSFTRPTGSKQKVKVHSVGSEENSMESDDLLNLL